MLELVFLPISADKVRGSARKRGSQIPYRMVKSRVVSHPVRNLGVKNGGCRALTNVCLCGRRLLRQAALLGFFFVLVVMPRTDRGVDEASEEEDKADKQYDSGHSTVKSVSLA